MIRRAPSRQRWVSVDNRAVEDTRLSLRAKGLLLYLLSRPDDWRVYPNQLATISTDGITTVRSCLRELRRCGYATLEVIVTGKGKAQLKGTEWVINELPASMTFNANESHCDCPILNTEGLLTNEKEHKVRAGARVFRKPSIEELEAYAQKIDFDKFDAQDFLDHYEANGWKVGRVPMKDWEATVRTWKRRQHDFKPNKPKLSYKTRNDRINELNKQKQQLMRENAPYWKIHELNMKLSKL